MWVRLLVTFVIFYILATLQQSFLPHWAIYGIAPNLVFILFLISAFLEPPKEYTQGLLTVLVAGFFQATLRPISFSGAILVLFVVYGLFKFTIHSLKQVQGRYAYVHFGILFCTFFSLWGILQYVLLGADLGVPGIPGRAGLVILVNLVTALGMLYAWRLATKSVQGGQFTLSGK